MDDTFEVAVSTEVAFQAAHNGAQKATGNSLTCACLSGTLDTLLGLQLNNDLCPCCAHNI